MSNVSRGTYYRYKTKKYLIAKGYEVEYLERLQRIQKPGGKAIWIKRDIFGCDLVAMDGNEVLWVQIKLGEKHIAEGRKEFWNHKFPTDAKRVIFVWERNAREPLVEEI